MRRALLPHVLLLCVAAIWGGHFVAIRFLLTELAPSAVMLLRGLLAGGFYVVFLAVNIRRLPAIQRADRPRLVLIGFLGIAIMGLGMVYAQRFISAGVSSLIVTLNPIFTALLAYLLLGQSLTRRQFFGVALGLVGFLVVMVFGAPGAKFSFTNVVGVVVMACSPFIWALYTVLSKPLLGRYPPHYVAAYSTVLGALFLLPIGTPPFWRQVAALDRVGWLSAIFSGIFAMALSYLVWYQALERLEPTQVAVYGYLVPVFGVLFAALLLHEALTPFTILGGATILVGVAVTNTGGRRAIA